MSSSTAGHALEAFESRAPLLTAVWLLTVSLSACSTGGTDAPPSSAAGGGGGTGPGAPVAGASTNPAEAAPRVARLTHFQWKNSVQDLLRLGTAPTHSAEFTPDPIVGFDTNASQLRVSGTLREDFERAAEALALQVVSDPAALARLVPEGAPTETVARGRAFIESFGLRAYRRPLSPAEVDQYLALFQRGPELVPELDAFAAGVTLCLRVFLQSPYFLYRTELGQDVVGGRIPLNGYEVAAKLALSLTGSIPDDALLNAAAAGALDAGNGRTVVEGEVQRLLASSRGEAAALHLHEQALSLARYVNIQREVANYPEFTPETPVSMRRSMELFLNAAYQENRGIKNLLTSTEAFVDANLAPLYGVSGNLGSEFQRIDLSMQPRRGLLTHPGFLSIFASEHQPDPIHRGVFINEQILCVELPPPADDIPLPPAPQPNQTNRQRIDLLTGDGTCGQACHATLINPLGFAFENYDPLGRYRTMDGGVPVDASDTYTLDGQEQSFANGLELVQLLSESLSAHRCYASHWLAYLYGRASGPGDAAVIDALAARSRTEDLSIKSVIVSLALDDGFLTRPAGE